MYTVISPEIIKRIIPVVLARESLSVICCIAGVTVMYRLTTVVVKKLMILHVRFIFWKGETYLTFVTPQVRYIVIF